MTGPDFVDSNVLVYAYVSTDPRKQGIAKDIVRRAIAGEGAASTQVLSEFATIFLHKFSPPARPEDLLQLLDILSPIALVPRLVGHANALDLLFSARMIDAAEALRMGLVNQVFPRETFLENVHKCAADLASSVSPRSLRVIKRQVYDAMFQTLAESFESSEQEMLASLQSEDFREGVAHFIEKRAPVFTGK